MALAVFRPVLLTLSLLLCSESAPTPHEFVEEGERVILPCNDVRDEQRECDGTSWMVKSKALITNGRISSSVPETLSKRLRVTQNCGLEILNVQPQDAGKFYCRYDQSVYLSVVSLTKEEDEENTELSCKVSSDVSRINTKWLFNGRNVNVLKLTTKTIQNGIAVTVSKSHPRYKSMDRLRCEVSHKVDKKEFFFRAKPEKTRGKPPTTTQTTNGEEESTSEPEPKTEAGWPWAVVVAVVGGLVIVVVVVVAIWMKLRGNPGDTRSEPTAEGEEGIAYATVSYNTNNQRIEMSEVVTYSLVGNAAVGNAAVGNTAVENPPHLYATVNKPTTDPTTDQTTHPISDPTTNQLNQPNTHPTAPQEPTQQPDI